MESIKYEITEKDIRDYLDNHSKDELIRFREALFVKYIKHHDIFSKEKIEMLLDKSSNNIDAAILGDCCSMLVLKYPFYSFILRFKMLPTSVTIISLWRCQAS